MSPDSLIFVVVLLIWATYLSLHVARRREQLSTARSVDRFSAHMRVLQRRSVQAVPRSAPVSSSGSTRTSILAAGALDVSEAVDPQTTAMGTADETARSTPRVGAAQSRAFRVRGPRLEDGSPIAARLTSSIRPTPGVGRPRGAVHSSRAFAAWGAFTGVIGRLASRRLRAYGLLLSLVVGVVAFPLAALGVAPAAIPGACAVLTFGLVAWLRRDRRAVLAARARRQTARRLAAERGRASVERAAQEEAVRMATATAAARPGAAPLPVAQEYVPPRERAPFDLSQFEPAAATRVPVATIDPLVAEHSWEPVPVPLPTYALKARAEHPLPPALPGPVPIDIMDEFEEAFWEADAKAVGH